jgi:hypothetical protein
LDAEIAAYFAEVIELARSAFEAVEYDIDATPQRSILRLQANYGTYRIIVTELFSQTVRKYRYYLIRGNYVEAGFDNSPDPRAIRLKYGSIQREYANEQIPHLHLVDKTDLILTNAMTFENFIEWIQDNQESFSANK